ncbi:PASTA domain-containing protein [Capillimicrobium parvum]|uniref:PASTA domain-containing protein n=1 Tax=Capillimicrobium parvum TaxID=2884022 RepID=A0A9E6XVW0_9ACTN|nr:PASTA domain-containing protein [Capillimicrobium parvum]UGS35420.1 hypothetical protein DSM104329_01808 [Capillimicrobium parvum]
MQPRTMLALAGATAAAAFALPAGASAATCQPATQTAADAAGDNEAGALDITAATASVDANCVITLSDQIAGSPPLGFFDILQWHLDTDNNPATGVSNGPFSGLDYDAVMVDDVFTFVSPAGAAQMTDVTRVPPYGVSFPAEMVGVAPGATMKIYPFSQRQSGAQFTRDDAAPLLLSVQAPPPPPPPPPPVRCVVPTLKGVTVKRARARLTAAHCALGSVHKRRGKGKAGRIVSSSPKAGTTAAGGTKVSVTVRTHKRKR